MSNETAIKVLLQRGRKKVSEDNKRKVLPIYAEAKFHPQLIDACNILLKKLRKNDN